MFTIVRVNYSLKNMYDSRIIVNDAFLGGHDYPQ